MKGEGTCSKSPDHADEHPEHCIHYRVKYGDFICCWCGWLFEGHEPSLGAHGQYRPRRERKRGEAS